MAGIVLAALRRATACHRTHALALFCLTEWAEHRYAMAYQKEARHRGRVAVLLQHLGKPICSLLGHLP